MADRLSLLALLAVWLLSGFTNPLLLTTSAGMNYLLFPLLAAPSGDEAQKRLPAMRKHRSSLQLTPAGALIHPPL